MKKISNYVLMTAAVLAITGTWTSPAYGASSYDIPGGKVVVIGGSSLGNLKDLANQIGGMISKDCGIWQPGDSLPQWPNFPGVPETPELPGLPDQPENPDSGETGSMDAFAAEVVQLVNEERQKAGLSPLTVNVQAVEAAQIRAQEIESVFSHTRPNGTSFVTALSEAGVSYSGAGENIAYGQKTPEQVMEAWMNSQGHRANILNSSFTSIGVGHYQNNRGVSYWTQLFIR